MSIELMAKLSGGLILFLTVVAFFVALNNMGKEDHKEQSDELEVKPTVVPRKENKDI
ncbi:hypothetical protein GNY16_20235 [Escherichia coli]|nr:hypothetical protein [Escherichia coli]EFI8595779.1 hypothetical protein [Escherichia coli]